MPELANQADLAHVHLLINHFPTIGTILGLGLLLLSFLRKNDHLKKVSLEVLFLIALATMPVYVSGQAAAEALKGQSGVSAAAIVAHNDAALGSFIMMEITGFFAWLVLWRMRRIGWPTKGLTYTVLVLSVMTIAAVARAANIGGDIRHPEISGGQYAGLFGQSSRFSGTSGALMFKPLTGFGFVAAGTGPFAGDLLIATRGTAKSADWLTDFNVGMQIGPDEDDPTPHLLKPDRFTVVDNWNWIQKLTTVMKGTDMDGMPVYDEPKAWVTGSDDVGHGPVRPPGGEAGHPVSRGADAAPPSEPEAGRRPVGQGFHANLDVARHRARGLRSCRSPRRAP